MRTKSFHYIHFLLFCILFSKVTYSQTLDKTLKVGTTPLNINVQESGAAAYSIPIECPPAIGQMVPQIGIVYNSQSGNGIVGWGTNISGVSAITRAPKNLYSDNEAKGFSIDTADRFVLDGNRLVSQTGIYGGLESTYRTENETFQHIISHGFYGQNSPSWFEVYAKNGTRYKYGSQTGRIIYNSNVKTAIVSWYLDYVEDIYGNTIQYTYEQKGIALYLTKITYGTNKSGAGTESTIEFIYQQRSDPIPLFYSPIKGQVDQILYKIVSKTGSQVFRTYIFDYTTDAFTRLSKVTEYNGAGEHLNPINLKWGNYNAYTTDANNYTLPVDLFSWQVSLGQRYWTTGDVNGDGLTDLLSFFYYDYEKINVVQPFIASVSSAGVISYSAGIPNKYLSNATFDAFHCYSSVSAIHNLNGDYTPDIVVPYFQKFADVCQIVFFALNASQDRPVYAQNLLSTTTEMPAYAIDDLNNDGIDDIVYVENSKINGLYQGKLHFGESNPNWANSINNVWLPFNINLNSPPKKVFACDFNLDGLKDILIVNDEGYIIYINKGKGDFETTNLVTNTFNGTNDILRTGDFNGDGLVDFVYNEHESPNWYFAINNGNLGFDKKYLSITAQNEDFTDKDNETHNCIVTDFNNDGKSDVIVFDANYEYHRSWSTVWGTFKQFTTYWYQSAGESVSLITSKTSTNEQDAYSQYYVLGDFNGDRLPDFMNYGYDCYSGTDMTQKWRLYSSPNPNYDAGMVNSVTNGLGQNTVISYTTTAQKINYSVDKYKIISYPLALLNSPVPVVKQVSISNGVSSDVVQKYSYETGTLDLQRGFLGFGKFIMTRNIANSTTTDKDFTLEQNYEFDLNYNNTHYYQPLMVSSKTTVGSTLITETNIPLSSYSITPLSNGPRHVFMYPGTSKQIDHLKKTSITTSVTYDNEGNILTNEVNTSDYTIPESTTIVASQKTTFSNYLPRISSNLNTYKNAPEKITTERTHKNDPGKTFVTSISFTYNNNGSISTKLNNSGTQQEVKESFTYDDFGNIANDTIYGKGLAKRINKYVYDASGRFLISKENSLGHKIEYLNLNTWGSPQFIKDPNNLKITYSYNSWGEVLHTISPDTTDVSDSVYWANGGDAPVKALYYKASMKDGRFQAAEYYDQTGRSLRKITSGYEGKLFFADNAYNAKGELISVTEPYPKGATSYRKNSFQYDSYGRQYSETTFHGVNITTNYNDDLAANKITTSYSTGEVYSKTYDASGLLTESTDPGGTIKYFYNCMGKANKIVGPGSTTDIEYYPSGLQKSLSDPNSGKMLYNYNAFGELVCQTDASGKKDSMTYDPLGRVSARITSESTTNYEYDTQKAGLLKKVTSGSKAGFDYTYDDLCRVSQETRGSGSEAMTFEYKYGSRSKLGQIKYPSGLKLNYVYNSNEDLIEIKKNDDNKSIWKLTEVNAKGQLKKVIYGNNYPTDFSYDSFDRLNSTGSIYVGGCSRYYNEKEQIYMRSEGFTNPSISENFTYDAANRLSTVSRNGMEALNMSYAPGVNDRIQSKSDIGTYYYSAGSHKLDSVVSEKNYNPQPHHLDYTMEGKIKTITENDKIMSFVYGTDDERFKSTYKKGGIIQYNRYYFDTYEKETNADGSLKRQLSYIYAPNGLVAIWEQKPGSEKMHYIYTNHLGSLMCVTDASGNIEQSMSYDAWGCRRNPTTAEKLTAQEISGLLFARGFTGHEHMDEFGLINMNGRVYDPDLGLFLSPDNYVQSPDNTQNFNRFAYCFNNPLMYSDPSGDFAWLPILAMAYMGGLQANFFSSDNPFNPADWNWNSASTYTGIATGGISGAGLVGINVASFNTWCYS